MDPPNSGPMVLESMKYTPPPLTAPLVASAQIERTVKPRREYEMRKIAEVWGKIRQCVQKNFT